MKTQQVTMGIPERVELKLDLLISLFYLIIVVTCHRTVNMMGKAQGSS